MQREREGIYVTELPYGCLVAVIMPTWGMEEKEQPKQEPLKTNA